MTKYSYDERNLLVKQDYGNGCDLMEYNELGQLVNKKDRKGQVLTFEYDQMGRNTKVNHYGSINGVPQYPNILDHTVATIYDFRGNAVRIDNQNLIEYYVYDYANRVTSLKRRIKTQGTRETIATVWGGIEATQEFAFAYEYNDAGMVTTMTYPDGNAHHFEYDGTLGRLENIMDGTTEFVSGFEYLKSGVVRRMDYHNNTCQEWEFDNRKRISNIKITGASDVIEDLRYTINGSGDILSINDNEYDYDGFDRIIYAKTFIPGSEDKEKLVAASFGTANGIGPIEVEGQTRQFNIKADLNADGRIDGADHAIASFINAEDVYDFEGFAYDKNGNRTRLVQNGDVYEYEYGDRNQLVKVSRTKKSETAKTVFAEYEYDANGNTTRRTIHSGTTTQVIAFEYDTMNRLVKTTEGEKVCEYAYDNAGNRFIKKDDSGTTLYLRHGQIAVAMDVEVNLVQTTDKGKINRYVLSGDLLAGRVTKTVHADLTTAIEKSWYHLDHLNSTKVVTNESGVIVVKYVYRAFGEQLKRLDANGQETTDKAKYSFGGKELDDETNLYYFNARYYDATIGRFINVDPIQDGSNWYGYCNNNPLSLKDPTGLAAPAALAVVGAVLNVAAQVADMAITCTSVVLGAQSAVDNFNKGKYLEAAFDVLGVALDVYSLMIPFVPGPVGVIKSSAKAATNLAEEGAKKAAKEAGKNWNPNASVPDFNSMGKKLPEPKGKPHGNPTHQAETINATMKSIDPNKTVKDIYYNKALKTAGLQGNQRPDSIIN